MRPSRHALSSRIAAPSGDGGQFLRNGTVSASGLVRALRIRSETRRAAGRSAAAPPRISLVETLRRHGLAEDAAIARDLARECTARLLDPRYDPPDPRLILRYGAARALMCGCVPWRRCGAVTLVTATEPEKFLQYRAALEAEFGPCVLALITEADLELAVATACRDRLRDAAQMSVPLAESCRTLEGPRIARFAALLGLVLLPLLLLWPMQLFLGMTLLLVLLLFISSGLRIACTLASLSRPPEARQRVDPEVPEGELPVISIMVPLFREADIAARLVARLGALSYPREKLDIMLLVEEDDRITRDALARTRLPGWMREVAAPEAALRTKPRALNYGLNFARGSLIGVYDAEDAPEPQQLRHVARAFAASPPELACLQGVLDYCNPRTNWLARCFTIEYAAWFRLVLPGLERLGLVVPLGGTTLFFRRGPLERLGGWDAWNVTEDADLGVRLARHGYHTRLLATVTMEEANCRMRPWVKQRSRWLKGYAMTWLTHMRAPRALWRELGPWRFFGLQVLLLGTLVHFLLAPIFWSFWLILLGFDLPFLALLPAGSLKALLLSLLAMELISLAINNLALSAPHHRFLRPWTLTLSLYFPLATFAAWKAAAEMVTRPFYWDKTTHGLHDSNHASPVTFE